MLWNHKSNSAVCRSISLPATNSNEPGDTLTETQLDNYTTAPCVSLPNDPHQHLYQQQSLTLGKDSTRTGSPQARSASPNLASSAQFKISSSIPRCPSLTSLSSFAESLVTTQSSQEHESHHHYHQDQQQPPPPLPPPHQQQQDPPHQQTPLLAASSSPSLVLEQHGPPRPPLPAKKPALASGAITRSTPNLDETGDGSMVTKNASMYSYLHSGASHSSKGSDSSRVKPGRYWDGNPSDTPNREDYAHHLRSSSYQILHSQQQLTQGPPVPYHSRQQSNASNYSDSEEFSSRVDQRHLASNNYQSYYPIQQNPDRSRYLSYDSIGPETTGQKNTNLWNISEPDLSSNLQTTQSSYYHQTSSHVSQSNLYHHSDLPQDSSITSSAAPNSMNMHLTTMHSNSSNTSFTNSHPPPPPLRQSSPGPTNKNPSSPPPPPVRDASSLKYIKYGPGHEKFPSWPVPAGSASKVMNSVSDHDPSGHDLTDSLTGPQGSHRSKSWTEQSEYPKDQSGAYTRPHHKKQLNPAYQHQLKTVMEKTEKIPPQLFESKLGDELSNPNCSLMDPFYETNSPYYPLYDRDGHGIDDKDYNIPSPPERDPGMGEANLSEVTAAQLEEYSRHYDYAYGGDMVGVTPFLDRLREESATWDGGSERDSGRGESESLADSFRCSNGRDSVTTVVTNSSSASSSETLKWHGSLSDISIMSGHSRDTRTEQNIVHSSRVLAPQRHNSESVLYYSTETGRKPFRNPAEVRGREAIRVPRETDSSFTKGSRDTRWNREVERNNEVNNLKKFPSYSYTQPLSQITEAPGAESHESNSLGSPVKSPTIDISKPPSVAERISELERQSRSPHRDPSQRFRDASEPRERTEAREARTMREGRRRDLSEPRGEYREESESKVDIKNTSLNYSKLSSDSNTTIPNEHIDNISESRLDNSLTISNNPMDPPSSHNISKPPARIPSDRRVHDQENIPAHTTDMKREKIPPLKNFAYLDPKKQCKVPDSTLKNIQKQALMSFYERRTGKKSCSSSSLSDHVPGSQYGKPPSPLAAKNSFNTRSASNIREDRSGLAGVSLARLGRVPDSASDSPSRPPRKRSVNGRTDLREDGLVRDNSESQRSSAVSDSTTVTGEAHSSHSVSRPSSLPLAPAIPDPTPATADARHADDGFENSRPSNVSRPPILPPTALDDSPSRPPERPPKKANLRSQFPGQIELGISGTNSFEDKPSGRPYYYRRPPAPDPPISPDNSPTAAVRPIIPPVSETNVLFNDSQLNGELLNSRVLNTSTNRFQRSNFNNPLNVTPSHVSLPNIGLGGSSPPPPLSPVIKSLATQAFRSSTPDLPPPPPPPPLQLTDSENTAIVDEEPLPSPPPTSEVSRTNSKKKFIASDLLSNYVSANSSVSRAPAPESSTPLETEERRPSTEMLNRNTRSPLPPPTPNTPPPPLDDDDATAEEARAEDGTYHKDSYMAQKKDWKNGFEGRYRRTSSPSASPIRNSVPRGPSSNVPTHPLSHHSSTKCLNTYNSNYSALSTSMLSSSTMALTSYPSNASSSGSSSLSSSVSSSKSKSGTHLKHSLSSTSSSSNSSAGSSTAPPRQHLYNSHIKPVNLDNENHVNNNSNGWPVHAREMSTTVNFTSEELRAFRSRKAAGEGYFQPPRTRPLPTALSTPTLVQPSSYNSQTTSNQGSSSSSSLASVAIDSSPKSSPSVSLRASLDSLQCSRVPSSSRPHGLYEGLPRACSVSETISSTGNDSLSPSTSIVESLSRSPSVAESYCRSSSVAETASSLSRTSSINEPTAPSPASLAYSSSVSDGAVIARPATVTEELSINLAPDPSFYETYEPLTNSILNTTIVEPIENHQSSFIQSSEDTTLILPSILNSTFTVESSDSKSAELNSEELQDQNNLLATETSLISNSDTPPTPPSAPPPLDPPTPPDTVTIGYGRSRKPAELECDQLSMEYVSRLGLDPRLQALLAPGPELKTTADYMEGVFTYEVRRDILASRAQHLIPRQSLQNGTEPINPDCNFNRSESCKSQPDSCKSQPDSIPNHSRTRDVDRSLLRRSSVPVSHDVNSGSLANRFMNSTSSSNHDSVTSLTNNKLDSPQVSRSSSYLGTSPVHLSSANQVANFTSLSSPIRSHDCKSNYLTSRSLSSQEHPNAFNKSLSSQVISESLTNGKDAFSSDEPRRKTSARSPLPSDSTYFTTSESKARLLTRLRSTSSDTGDSAPTSPVLQDSQALLQKKEELMSSISRKLEILRAEQEAIKEEMRLNTELGAEVTVRVEQEAKTQEIDKYKLHVEEIDKITSLLLGLSGRLARAENALLLLTVQDGQELKRMLEHKRDRLGEQLEEAMLLKENIDRRAKQVDKSLEQYLTESEFADYDHFIKMKAKLVMDAREISDKIKLGEEQMAALRDTFKATEDTLKKK